MKWILPVDRITAKDRRRVGGKTYSLHRLHAAGMPVPKTVCITTDAYNAFLDRTGLRERIQLELHRKDLGDMRWEEIWDCATRIRNLFLRPPLPAELENALSGFLQDTFSDGPAAVRSSAPDEDAAAHSFAGLHASYLNIRGAASILKQVRKVWASLWSDAALLYRQELGLDIEKSAMAVIVQELIEGDVSGVTFTRAPQRRTIGVVEAVYGLNAGLVDGAVEPDRWIIGRKDGAVREHRETVREQQVSLSAAGGVHLQAVSRRRQTVPPLTDEQVGVLFQCCLKIEAKLGRAQDVEWTRRRDEFIFLQARPVTTDRGQGDQRSWYLSLHRSFENLQSLRTRIEKERIPEMKAVARKLADQDLRAMDDAALTAEIQRRWKINQDWVDIYWAEFIPFAHGVRLFGRMYNDAVHPDDPFEFVELLTDSGMVSMNRNRSLERMATLVAERPQLADFLQAEVFEQLPEDFAAELRTFLDQYGDLSCGVSGATGCDTDLGALANILRELAARPEALRPDPAAATRSPSHKKRRFLDRFQGAERDRARRMLDLARASYRLRDDDNIHLGRIEAGLIAAMQEGHRRLEASTADHGDNPDRGRLREILNDIRPPGKSAANGGPHRQASQSLRARQIVGQPAGPGIANGRARVIRNREDLARFKSGEILVCDAIDPNMTYVIPLVAGIVERRGGMLIHGAIIAREYGLPCVTGVPDAVDRIQTGDGITVDGFLGIVTIDARDADFRRAPDR
ncbi:MAG TPA: PEP/pyruvate-binding domain-containing protein [Desulfobacterales bacterium]